MKSEFMKFPTKNLSSPRKLCERLLDPVNTVDLSERSRTISITNNWSGLNPFINDDICDCYFDYEQVKLLRNWMSRISKTRSAGQFGIRARRKGDCTFSTRI